MDMQGGVGEAVQPSQVTCINIKANTSEKNPRAS